MAYYFNFITVLETRNNYHLINKIISKSVEGLFINYNKFIEL